MDIGIRIYFIIAFGISLGASFSWKNCGSTTDPIKILSLEVDSNQTKILYVNGRGKVAMNITGPIQAHLGVHKKFFWGWTSVPCVNNLGSCTYHDICDMSPFKNETCPSEFLSNNLPCRCPILQGQYLIKNFPLLLNKLPHWVERGKYRIQMVLSESGKELLCLAMTTIL